MKIALVQAPVNWGKTDESLAYYDRKFASDLECDLILLPEMFTSGSILLKKEQHEAKHAVCRLALHYDRVRKKMLEWARKQHALILGSTACEEEGAFYNRLIAAFPDGTHRHYDKRHCFSMAGENEYITPGASRLVFDFKGIKIAAFICYDLRFPVWSRNTEGYDLAVYVANWPKARREAWKALLKARAIENQCFVAGVNCVGEDNNGVAYAGDSMLIDARGDIIAACWEEQAETASVEIDVADLCDFRRKFPVLEDRDAFTIL